MTFYKTYVLLYNLGEMRSVNLHATRSIKLNYIAKLYTIELFQNKKMSSIRFKTTILFSTLHSWCLCPSDEDDRAKKFREGAYLRGAAEYRDADYSRGAAYSVAARNSQ